MMTWRRWHRWLGTISGILLVLIAGTGILLQIDEVGHISAPPPPPKVDKDRLSPVDPMVATRTAVALIDQRHEGRDILSFRLQAREGGTAAIVHFRNIAPGIEIDLATGKEKRLVDERPPKYVLLNKIRLLVLNIHTFGIVGPWGHIVGAVLSVFLVFLGGSGLWMWFTLWRERAKRSKRSWFWR